MNFKMIGRFAAKMLSIEALFMLPALVISLGYGERASALGFLFTVALIALVSGALWLVTRGASNAFYAKEGLVCVGLSWVMLSLMGALPLVFSGAVKNYIDAFFEIVSGFTTTGASALRDVEILPRGILYWRSFTHWLGGMGVLVFLLALTPGEKGEESGFTMHLLRAESPGPDVGKIAPKMKQTATILYWIYISLTVINFLFLIFDMPWFDALCTAFGTAGTGGFGIKNDSMASYSPYIQTVTGVFMLLFGVNFSCYYLILLKRFKNVFKDEELKLYVGIVVASVIAITVNLFGTWASLGTTLRHSFFQVSSIITTTGFSSCDFDVWPAFSKAILMLLMVVGACAGSTGGGFKCARVLLLFKNLRRNIQQMVHPNRVVAVKNNGKMIDEKIVANTNAYLAAYVIIIVFSILAISLDGYSVETNVSSVLACFNNIGPGFDAVGPIRNYADFSVFSKLVLIFNMLAGRLEIFPMLLLFSAGTWSRK